MHKVLIAGAILFGAGLIPFSDIEAKVGGGMDRSAIFATHVERYHLDMQHMEDRTALTVRMLQERIAMHEARLERQKERLTLRTCDRLQKLQSRRSVEQTLPAFCGGTEGEDSTHDDEVETPPETEQDTNAEQEPNTEQDTGSGQETDTDQDTGSNQDTDTEQGTESEQGSGDTNNDTGTVEDTDSSQEEGNDTNTDTDTNTDNGTGEGTDTGSDTEEGTGDGSGEDNTVGDGGEETSDPIIPVSHGRLVISEVLYSLVASQGSEAQGENEWIELFNGSDTTIDLVGYAIGDSAGKDVLAGDGLLLLPGAYAIITPEASTLTFWDVPEGTLTVIIGNKLGSNGLGNSGDAVFLYNQEDTVIDAMSYGTNEAVFPAGSLVAPKGSSLARVPVTVDTDTPEDWVVLEAPTPGR